VYTEFAGGIGFRLCVGRDVPLWPLVPADRFGWCWYPDTEWGAVMGDVAVIVGLLRLGA